MQKCEIDFVFYTRLAYFRKFVLSHFSAGLKCLYVRTSEDTLVCFTGDSASGKLNSQRLLTKVPAFMKISRNTVFLLFNKMFCALAVHSFKSLFVFSLHTHRIQGGPAKVHNSVI